MKNGNYYNALIRHYLNDQKSYRKLLVTDDDPGYVVSRGVAQRDSDYTNLLENYVKLTHIRNILKEIHKWLFFWIIVVGTVIATYVMMRFVALEIINTKLADGFNYEPLIALISALVSLVTVIVSIPIIITKYLFNNDEDNNITAIIKETQEHDSKEITLLDDYFKADPHCSIRIKNNYVDKRESNDGRQELLDYLTEMQE